MLISILRMANLLMYLLPANFHLWHIPLVFLAGLIGEGYGTVIGSGGILIQFVLATLGIPIQSVIATDQAGATGASVGVISALPGSTWVNKKLIILLAIPSFLGGIIGTLFLIHFQARIIKYVLIFGLILLIIRMIFRKSDKYEEPHKIVIKLRQYPLIFSVMSLLGIYMNVSGVGVGTFQRFTFVSLLKMRFADSLGIGNLIAIPLGIFSFVVTAFAGLIVWPYLIPLWLGTYLGGRHVTKYVRKIPDNVLRTILLIVVVLYLAYLLWSLS